MTIKYINKNKKQKLITLGKGIRQLFLQKKRRHVTIRDWHLLVNVQVEGLIAALVNLNIVENIELLGSLGLP